MKTTSERSKRLLSHKNPFGFPAEKCLSGLNLSPPNEDQYILRMMLRAPWTNGFQIPSQLDWLRGMIRLCDSFQIADDILNPFVYVTVRHGIVKSTTDDLWHVDGFSMRVPHIPEQNYILASNHGTEVLEQDVRIPSDFDPMKHNIHQYFQDVADEKNIKTLEDNTIYRIDPYVIHRRPTVTAGIMRTFVRVSFIPIEIEDDTCMVNPLIPRPKPYNRSDIRNILQRYHV